MRKHFEQTYVGIILFFVMLMIGTSLVKYKWNGLVEYTPSNKRLPATKSGLIPDLASLTGIQLKDALYERTFISSQSIIEENKIGIRLGHFNVKHEKNKPGACDVYDKIILTFYADNMASPTEPTKMTISSNCIIDNNVAYISPIWIPLNTIINDSTSSDIQIVNEHTQNGITNITTITFDNTNEEWPRLWSLKYVEFTDSNNNSLVIPQRNIDDEDFKNFSLDWSAYIK